MAMIDLKSAINKWKLSLVISYKIVSNYMYDGTDQESCQRGLSYCDRNLPREFTILELITVI